MRNCIYSSGEVVQVGEGPCAPYLDGAELVDTVDESETVNVYTEPPTVPDFSMFGGFVLVLILGAVFSARRY